MSYRPVPETFRLTPVKGLKGSINSTFKPQRVGMEIKPIFDLLSEVLIETKYGLLKKNVFSLVNVFNPLTEHSVGYLAAPPASVITPFSGLAFTFALTPRPLKNPPKEIHSTKIIDFTHYWGKDLKSSLDYLTINIPIDFLRKLTGDYPYVDDLQYLYNAIGMMTKNFVLNRVDIHDNSPIETLNVRFFGQTLPHVFKNVGRSYWKYNRNVWTECSNLLDPENFNDHFYLYFAIYFYDQVGENIGNRVKEKIFGTSHTDSYNGFLMDGLRSFVQNVRNLNGNVIHEKSLTAVVSLMLVLIDGEGLSSENEQLEIENFILNLRSSFVDNPERKMEFISKFSDLSSITRALITLDQEHSAFDLWR